MANDQQPRVLGMTKGPWTNIQFAYLGAVLLVSFLLAAALAAGSYSYARDEATLNTETQIKKLSGKLYDEMHPAPQPGMGSIRPDPIDRDI